MKINLAQLSTKDLATLSQRTITISDEPAYAVVKDNPLLAAVKTGKPNGRSSKDSNQLW